MNRALSLLSVLFLLPPNLYAHDLYILPEVFVVAPKTKLSVAFHNGDAFPASEGAPPMARLRNAQLRSASSTIPLEGLKVDGKRVVGTVEIPSTTGTFIISVQTVPNFIQMEPDKFLDYLKEEGLAQIIEWRSEHRETRKPSRERYSKFAKAIVSSGGKDEVFKQETGFPIEIIPDVNPSTVHPGSALPVRVLFRGKPAAGLQLEAAWAANGENKATVIGRTDAEGKIWVPIAMAGKWRLHSLVMERCAEPVAADWESFWASLTFEVR